MLFNIIDRMTSASLNSAFARWFMFVFESQRQQLIVERALKRFGSASLFAVWDAWLLFLHGARVEEQMQSTLHALDEARLVAEKSQIMVEELQLAFVEADDAIEEAEAVASIADMSAAMMVVEQLALREKLCVSEAAEMRLADLIEGMREAASSSGGGSTVTKVNVARKLEWKYKKRIEELVEAQQTQAQSERQARLEAEEYRRRLKLDGDHHRRQQQAMARQRDRGLADCKAFVLKAASRRRRDRVLGRVLGRWAQWAAASPEKAELRNQLAARTDSVDQMFSHAGWRSDETRDGAGASLQLEPDQFIERLMSNSSPADTGVHPLDAIVSTDGGPRSPLRGGSALPFSPIDSDRSPLGQSLLGGSVDTELQRLLTEVSPSTADRQRIFGAGGPPPLPQRWAISRLPAVVSVPTIGRLMGEQSHSQ